MKKFAWIIPVLFLLFSCHDKKVSDEQKDSKSAVRQEVNLYPIDSSTASEPYLAFCRIMDTAVELVGNAQTPDEVVAAAEWYYDHYYGIIKVKGIDWYSTITENEMNTHNQRDKEFVTLFRNRHVELGGTSAARREEFQLLMIKCLQYQTQLKKQQDSTANAASSNPITE